MALFDCHAFSPNNPASLGESDCAYDSTSDVDSEGDAEPLPKRPRANHDAQEDGSKPERLFNLAVDVVASKIAFKTIEQYYRQFGNKLRDNVIIAIIKRAFPTDQDMVGICAALSRSHFDGDDFYRESVDSDIFVKDVMQTGLSLTGTLVHKRRQSETSRHRQAVVSILFDRRCITSASCSVHRQRLSWCKHVLRLIHHRICRPEAVAYRLPISFTLERLSRSQMQKLIGSLYSSGSIRLHSSANRAICDMNHEGSSIATCSHSPRPVVSNPDLTTEGSRSDSRLWLFDEKRVRRVMKRYCSTSDCMNGGRSYTSDPDEPMFIGEWCRILEDNRKRSLVQVERDIDAKLNVRAEKELDCLLTIVEHLLKSADDTVLTVLNVLTEQWLSGMEKTLRMIRRQLPSDERARDDDTDESNLTYSKNKELLLSSGRAWYVADRLTFCWRLAVLHCHYPDKVVESIRDRNIEWAIRLRRITSEARRLYDSIDDIDDGWLEFFAVYSLQHWNGFCHVQALAFPQAREVFRQLVCSSGDDSSCNDDNEADDEGSESLRTLSCFIQSLRFYGYNKIAAALAVKAIISYLPSSSLQSVDIGGLTMTNLSLTGINQCHQEINVHLWGGDDSDDDDLSKDPVVLAVLLQAVVDDDEAWNVCYNVCYVAVAPTNESDEDCGSPLSPAMASLPLPAYVLLECIRCITDDFMIDTVVQLDFVVELNKLLFNVTNRTKLLDQSDILVIVDLAIEAAEKCASSLVKLAFLFRIRLSDLGMSRLFYPSFMICECLETLAGGLSYRIGGLGSNEDFYLALSDYSSVLFQSIPFCTGFEKSSSTSLAIEAAMPDIDMHSLHLFMTRTRCLQFLNELLQIATVVCPTVGPIATCSSFPNNSLLNRLEALNLPSYSRDDGRPYETSDSRSERDRIEGVVACRLIANVLTISRKTKDWEFVSLRRRALSGLIRVAAVLGSITVLEVVSEDDWLCVMSWCDVINYVLFEPHFLQSFKFRACEELAPSVEKMIREVILDRLYSFPSDDVLVQDIYYEAVKELSLTSLLTQDVLSNIRDTSRLSYRLLFRLCEDLSEKPSDALEIGVKAYTTMWSYFFSRNERAVVPHSPSSFSLLLRGAHCLGAAAMQLDLNSTPSGAVTTLFENTKRVLRVIAKLWEDALVAFHVVAEMARVYHQGHDHSRPFYSEFLRWYNSSSALQPEKALLTLSLVNSMVPVVLNRCKGAILATLAKDCHIKISISFELPKLRRTERRLTGDDFLCLQTTLRVLPDSKVDMQFLTSHSALCLWRDAAMCYFGACRSDSHSEGTNCYESYYRQLICDKSLRNYLFSNVQSERDVNEPECV